jgi:hypothetical protein
MILLSSSSDSSISLLFSADCSAALHILHTPSLEKVIDFKDRGSTQWVHLSLSPKNLFSKKALEDCLKFDLVDIVFPLKLAYSQKLSQT